MNKGKLKIRSVLIAINIVVLIVIISFYGVRMIKFYKAEHAVVENKGDTTFLSILTNKKSVVDLSKGLVYDEKTDTYTYKGKVEDNYLYYSGIMFRIVGIDSSNNIKLVSDKNLTMMYSGLDKAYEESYIYKWLNYNEEVKYSGVFDKLLHSKESYLTSVTECIDVITDLTNITCDEHRYTETYSILSLNDYMSSGAKEGYLNGGADYYLSTKDDKNQNYYVSATGEIGTDNSVSKIHGVRPVLSIKSNIKLLSGTGTRKDPYVIEEHDIDLLKDVNVGDIVAFSDKNWKVVEVNEDSVKVVATEVIKDGEENLSKTFGGKSNKYSTSKNTIGSYLNSTYYKSLTNPEYIVTANWYTGGNDLGNLDYANKYSSSVKANIGMLSLSELFVSELPSVLTITPGLESSTIIMVISDKNNVFGDLIATKYNIRPALYLKGDLEIVDGCGNFEDPYKVAVKQEVSTIEE